MCVCVCVCVCVRVCVFVGVCVHRRKNSNMKNENVAMETKCSLLFHRFYEFFGMINYFL